MDSPRVRIDVPVLIMYLGEYSTENLEILESEFERAINALAKRAMDTRLLHSFRRRAKNQRRKAVRQLRAVRRELEHRR